MEAANSGSKYRYSSPERTSPINNNFAKSDANSVRGVSEATCNKDIDNATLRNFPVQSKATNGELVLNLNAENHFQENYNRCRISSQGKTQAANNPIPLDLNVGHKEAETVNIQAKPLSQPNSRSLFDPRLPSALKVTNIEDAKEMLRSQIKKGWRWVSENFINDDHFPGYCVEALDNKENKQVRLNKPFKDLQTGKYNEYVVSIDSDGNTQSYWRAAEHNLSNIKRADIVLSNQVFSNGLKKYCYVNNDGVSVMNNCPANCTTQELKKYFDEHNLKDFKLPSSIVLKARQMPSLGESDWVIMEGKTMRLIKTGSEMHGKLENLMNMHGKRSDELQSLTDDLSRINLKSTMPELYFENFPSDFFNDSYAKLAGAYIRHLERLPKLLEAFNTFFDVKEKIKSVFDVKENKEKTKLFSVAYNGTTRYYKKYLSVQLKIDPDTKKELILTQAHLKLIHQALGIIDIEGYPLTDQSTIANTIPFKKVLEMLTCFDPVKYEDCPWEVSLPIFGGQSFLLSRGQFGTTDKQLVVSQLYPDGGYVGSSYPDLAGPRYGAEIIPAKIVSGVLNNPLSHSVARISWAEVILEFLVCTQVVEAHCTPGYLKDSRVPGTGKLARAILQHHIHHPEFQVFTSFNVAKHLNRMFPMAPKGGTGTTRKAVQSLKKPSSFSHFNNGDIITTSIEAASCRGMSTESDVEEISEVWDSGEGRWD